MIEQVSTEYSDGAAELVFTDTGDGFIKVTDTSEEPLNSLLWQELFDWVQVKELSCELFSNNHSCYWSVLAGSGKHSICTDPFHKVTFTDVNGAKRCFIAPAFTNTTYVGYPMEVSLDVDADGNPTKEDCKKYASYMLSKQRR